MATATARWLVLFLSVSAAWAAYGEVKWNGGATVGGMVVEKERRRVVAASEAGTVTAADVADAAGTVYRLQFITMEPGSLFLPVQLHADMVFYVHSGRGKVTYIQEGGSEASALEVERGDVYNLEQGTILYIQSYPNATRERLRIYAIFSSSAISSDDPSHPTSEAYSNVSNLLKGFEVEILRRGFGVPTEVVEPIKSAPSPPLIIPYNPKDKEEEPSNWTEEILDAFWGIRDPQFLNKKKKKDKDKRDKDKKSKDKTFNFYSGEPDVKNCHGWSKTMTNEDLQNLRESNIGMFMVNLTTGSMMGPHWNPKATEIAIVTHGSGIVQTVCPSSPSGEGKRGGEGIKCKNSLFRVKEGDVFVVPRFHPMAQMSFNNDSFVFVGFSTHMGQNHPQFLAGKLSALQVIGKEILALSLGQDNSTDVEKLLSAQSDSTILTCVSCAEELEKKVEQEEQEREKEKREREEEERRKKEEEERARREEEERRRKEEEEKARKEEEERRKREEEKARQEEEEGRRREEEEKARQEEEERTRREEEKARKEEEEKARQEEEERRRREEEKARKEEEERARQEEEERKREEKSRKEEEERARKEKEEEEARRQREKEEQKRQEEEERARREQEQEEAARARREQEAQEEARREQEAQEEARREQEERARREQEEEERRRREEQGGGGGGGGDQPSEEEEGRRSKQEEGGRGREDEPRKEDEGGDWGDSQNHTAKKLKKRYSLRKGAVL